MGERGWGRKREGGKKDGGKGLAKRGRDPAPGMCLGPRNVGIGPFMSVQNGTSLTGPFSVKVTYKIFFTYSFYLKFTIQNSELELINYLDLSILN